MWRSPSTTSLLPYATSPERLISLRPTMSSTLISLLAADASLNKYSEALTDAMKTVELKPDWSKDYSRLDVVHLGEA